MLHCLQQIGIDDYEKVKAQYLEFAMVYND